MISYQSKCLCKIFTAAGGSFLIKWNHCNWPIQWVGCIKRWTGDVCFTFNVTQWYTQTLFVLAQWGCTALLRAAFGGSVPVVRALLEDYGSSVDELTEVSIDMLPWSRSHASPDTQSIVLAHHLWISTIKRVSNAHIHTLLSNAHTCNCSDLFTSFISCQSWNGTCI